MQAVESALQLTTLLTLRRLFSAAGQSQLDSRSYSALKAVVTVTFVIQVGLCLEVGAVWVQILERMVEFGILGEFALCTYLFSLVFACSTLLGNFIDC